MANDIEHLTLLSELTEFIHSTNPDVESLCQFAVMRTFKHLDAAALFVSQLGSDAMIRQFGSFGLSEEMQQSWGAISINDHLPPADCIRTNQMYWMASAQDWYRDYPHLEGYKIEEKTKTFIAWPIRIKRSPMSMIGLILQKSVRPTPQEMTFVGTAGGLLALHLSSECHSIQESNRQIEEINFPLLSQRQKDILKLMAEGLTNHEIGTNLAYSESTVRQETMRIYKLFEASGRSEAIRKYRSIHGYL